MAANASTLEQELYSTVGDKQAGYMPVVVDTSTKHAATPNAQIPRLCWANWIAPGNPQGLEVFGAKSLEGFGLLEGKVGKPA